MGIYLATTVIYNRSKNRLLNDVFQVQLLNALSDVDGEMTYEYDTSIVILLESKSDLDISIFEKVGDKVDKLMTDYMSAMNFTTLDNKIVVLFVNWNEFDLSGEAYRIKMIYDKIVHVSSMHVDHEDSVEDKVKFINQILEHEYAVEDGGLKIEMENALEALELVRDAEKPEEETQCRSSAEALWRLSVVKAMGSLEEKINRLTKSLEKIEKKVFND